MATIVSSVLTEDRPQHDGRRWITELHTDSLGHVFSATCLVEIGVDAIALLASRAARFLQNAVDTEIERNIDAIMRLGSLASPILQYSTASQNVTALRDAYRSASDREAIMIGDYLNTLTDAQLRNAFSLTQAQVTTLRTNKLTPAATAAAAIRAAVGE